MRSQADGHHDDVCDDCGTPRHDEHGSPVWGFGSVITQTGESRMYCSECKTRRGIAYKFDPRSWADIMAATGRVVA